MEDGVVMAKNLREPLIRLIDSRLDKGETSLIGTATSPAYRWYDDALAAYLWVMDVDLGNDWPTAYAIPIADASHGVHKVGPGAKLRLVRSSNRRTYEIVGVASIVAGQVTVVEVTYSDVAVVLGAPQTFGNTYRPLDYTELGDSANNGGYAYGVLPYGTLGKFDSAGNLVSVLAP
jgi:hypothetical protein